MTHHTASEPTVTTATPALFSSMISLLQEVLVPSASVETGVAGPGRPPTVLLPHLLLACLLQTMRQHFCPAALARLLQLAPVGGFAPVATITRQAVRQRLLSLGLAPVRHLLQQVQTALAERSSGQQSASLAPFATMVVAVDESHLAAVAALCDDAAVPPTAQERLLVGKLCAVFDVRRHLWLHVQLLSDPFGMSPLSALLLLETLPTGSLILADLGYFGFLWFHYLSDHGQYWLSRLKANSSYQIAHISFQRDDLLDALVWLGSYRSHQYPYLVRLIQYRHHGTLYRYLTNVTDPQQLPLHEVPTLYGRRWDIEMAFNLLKHTLGLHLWWACEQVLVLQQLLLALCLSQLIAFLQGEIAFQAHVDLLDVSAELLMQVLADAPTSESESLVAMLGRRGQQLGLIRPSRYCHFDLPVVPPHSLIPVPPFLPRSRPIKRTVRKRPRHPRRTDPFTFRFAPLLLL